jgi:hypothetical protein
VGVVLLLLLQIVLLVVVVVVVVVLSVLAVLVAVKARSKMGAATHALVSGSCQPSSCLDVAVYCWPTHGRAWLLLQACLQANSQGFVFVMI